MAGQGESGSVWHLDFSKNNLLFRNNQYEKNITLNRIIIKS